MSDSETRWFKVISFVATGIIAGVLLADIIYFNELRSGSTLSSKEIVSMLIISGILFTIVVALFIWSMVRLFFHKDTRQQWVNEVKQGAKEWVTTTDGGVTRESIAARLTPSSETRVTSRQKIMASD